MSYPQRSGEPDCRDFLRTGRCKYGESCKYHHPLGGVKTTDPNEPPFPIRPDEPLCQYFLKNGTCKFGQTCKFHHPAHMIGKARALNPFTTPGISGVGVGTTMNSPNSNHPSAHMQEIRNTNDFGVVLPHRPHEPDCIYFLKHGRCKYGATCKYHHPGNVNTRCVPVSNPRYVSHSNPSASALYEISSSRGRSASNGSMTEGRDSLSQGTFLRGSGSGSGPGASSAHVNVYQSIGMEQGKLVDSVPHPQRPRNETLETISNTYHPYSHSQHSQRFPKNSTPDGSPTLGSPSVTSSTIASSYDTAVLSIEKLPQALSQHQNGNIRRTLSSNSHHSRGNSFSEYDGGLAFDDVGAGPTNSYEQSQTQSQSRISNIRHSSSYQPQPMPAPNNNYSHHHYDMEGSFPPTHANNRTLSMDNSMFQPSTGTSAGIGPSPYGNGDRSIYHQERQVNVNRDRDMLNNVRRGSIDDTVVRPHAVDDGLSMMTSALLTMLDAPWTGNGPGNGGHENADTISTHSSNFEDNSNCNLPLSSHTHTHTNQDLLFISRSLPEYGSSQPIGIGSGIPNQRRDTLLNLRQPSQSANVNIPYQFASNQGQQLQSNQNGNGNNGNGFHNNNQLQSQSQQLHPIPSHASDRHLHNPDPGRGPRRNSFNAPLYNNNAPATSTHFNNLGIVSAVAKPSPAADNLRRHGHPGAIGNPNSDTVNRNRPFTQFPLAP